MCCYCSNALCVVGRVPDVTALLEGAMEIAFHEQVFSEAQGTVAAYILTWLVAMALMSQCSPEVSVAVCVCVCVCV